MNGRLIGERLEELAISDERLAAEINCSKGTIYNMKRGRACSIELLVKAATYLKLDVRDLVYEKSSWFNRKRSRSA